MANTRLSPEAMLAVKEALEDYRPSEAFDIAAFEQEVEAFLAGGRTNMPSPSRYEKPRRPKVQPHIDYQRDFLGYVDEMQRRQDYYPVSDMMSPPQDIVARERYRGSDRVKFDVRLHERQIPEAMSTESKVFKNMIQRGVEKDLLRALDASAGMGLLKEDWQVLRQSLIEMLQEQARLYYRGDVVDDCAVVTFEIPKMTLSFRMPVDRFGNQD